MKKRIAIIGGLVVAVGIVGGIAWHFLGSGTNGSSEDAVYVTTVSTLTGELTGTQNSYSGVVEPQQTVKVKLEKGRSVKEIKVEEGQNVKQGDVLFEYDASASEDDLAQAKLDLERYKNEATSLEKTIKDLEEQKAKASADQQLEYTIEIQTNEMDLKKNEYNQKSKAAEIEKLEKASVTPDVTSEIDGVIKSINESLAQSDSDSALEGGMDSGDSGEDSSENVFMTIVATGSYRVKGMINETNIYTIVEGSPVIVRSRVDKDVTWKGTMAGVDTEEGTKSNTDMYDSGSSSDDTSSSTTYPFYVNLESADGLILGQHVYIEMDYGQDEVKEGLWLDESFIVDADGDAYVWASDSRDRLEKRSVTLGDYNEELLEYQITDGLTEDDCIAFPADDLEEGMATSINEQAMSVNGQGVDSGAVDSGSVDSGLVDSGSVDSGSFDSDSGSFDSDSGSFDSDSSSFDSDSGVISGGADGPVGLVLPGISAALSFGEVNAR